MLVRDGRIAELRAPDAAPLTDPALDVRDVTGTIVTPGLVDLHGHWYEGSAYGIDPAVSLRSGVPTAVDAGTAGVGDNLSAFLTADGHAVEQPDGRDERLSAAHCFDSLT